MPCFCKWLGFACPDVRCAGQGDLRLVAAPLLCGAGLQACGGRPRPPRRPSKPGASPGQRTGTLLRAAYERSPPSPEFPSLLTGTLADCTMSCDPCVK